MSQLTHPRRQDALMLELGKQKIDRHRQLGRCQNFFSDRGKHLLGGHVLRRAVRPGP